LYKYYNYSYCNVLWDWLSLSKTEQTQGESWCIYLLYNVFRWNSRNTKKKSHHVWIFTC
jgi:hypothetical protein